MDGLSTGRGVDGSPSAMPILRRHRDQDTRHSRSAWDSFSGFTNLSNALESK
jgi:hypothetical protein